MPDITQVARVPLTHFEIDQAGHWWWFLDPDVMDVAVPVLVQPLHKRGKTFINDPCYFMHPSGEESLRIKSDAERAHAGCRFVRNWKDCFHGPCFLAEEVGVLLT